MSINIGAFLAKRAMLSPEREALVCEDVRRTFAECNERANKFAHAAQKLGVRHGDREAILALNEPEYMDAFFGLGKIGAILVPINYRLAGPEIQYILRDSESSVLVFGKEYVEIIDSIRNDIPAKEFIAITDDPPAWAQSYESVIKDEPESEPDISGGDDDVLSILYTSGTTGRPKGAMLTHRNYFCTSVNIFTTVGYTGETALVALPLFHIGGLAQAPIWAHHGVRVVLLRSIDPTRFLELIEEEKVTAFGSVPALLQILKLVPDFEKYDWSSVRVLPVYAAPVPVTMLKEYDEAGIEVRNLYGLTESTGSGTVIDSEHAMLKAGSCGLPMFHMEVRLVDGEGNDVGPDELGEVIMRGDAVMKGYWNNPEETAKTIKDGWLYTGDIAKKDSDGFFYIMDRKKDMIISGGENIYPAEIEDVILGHPKIIDVGVIGFPHELWGEAVKAVVVVKEGDELTGDELIEWC
ncbi:MAG: AMP-binding protein, partial [Actinobacteria bacterium]|nr:AMP-binding protein [Actinomycetota bacterium]